MRLIRCKIDGYGKIVGQEFEFTEGLTVFQYGNGFGKTTLASFIESMFYGLPDLRQKQIDSNEQLHYDPWQAKAFGGSLEFEYKGVRYRVVRDFGKDVKKVVLKDISGAVVKDVTELDGRAIDGGNLGEILFGVNKVGFRRSAYIPQEEIACRDLDSGLNDKLRNVIHATGNGPSFKDAMDKLQKASDAIASKRGKGKLADLDAEIARLTERVQRCEWGCKHADEARERLKKLNEDLDAIEKEIARLDEQLELQSEEEALAAQRSHYAAIQKQLATASERVSRLQTFFKEGADRIELDDLESKVVAFAERQRAVDEALGRVQAVKGRVAHIEDAQNARQERRKMLYTQLSGFEREQKEKETQKESISSQLRALEGQSRAKGFLYVLLCILTFGIYHVVSQKRQQELAQKRESLVGEQNALQARLGELASEAAQVKAQIDELDSSASAPDTTELTQADDALRAATTQRDAAERALQDMLEFFACTGRSYEICLHEIKTKSHERAEANREFKRITDEKAAFLKGKDEKKLSDSSSASLDRSLREKREAADKKRLDYLEVIAETKLKIETETAAADGLSGYASELALCVEQRQAYETQLANLRHAMELLQKANDALANRYLMPLMEKCKTFMQQYDSDRAALSFDQNGNVLLSEGGFERELAYFSRGIQELVGICLRMALVDLVFTDSQKRPFVILDDPFVNLDDEKCDLAKKLVQQLAQKTQIIYMTCHGSRAITA